MPLVLLLRHHATPSAKALILSARAPCDRRREPAQQDFHPRARSEHCRPRGYRLFIICLRADQRRRRPRNSQGLRHCREVAAHDLPITTLFDEHQRGSPMQRQGLPVLCRSHKRCRRRSRSQRCRCTRGMMAAERRNSSRRSAPKVSLKYLAKSGLPSNRYGT